MKKYIFATILGVLVFTLTAQRTNAQTIGSSGSPVEQTTTQQQQVEEQEGKKLLDQLKNKTTTCEKLTDDNFEKIGEYFMGQAIGDTSRHIAMNEMMKGMMGEQGEEQMHSVWGKRGSGCGTSSQNTGFIPMMGMIQMMGGGGNPIMGYGGWNNMIGWGGFGLFGWLSMIISWILLILGVVTLIRYLSRSGQNKDDKTPLDILKERYARGEIDKKEFEERKKDLG